jgi:hypothetical protein
LGAIIKVGFKGALRKAMLKECLWMEKSRKSSEGEGGSYESSQSSNERKNRVMEGEGAGQNSSLELA